MKFLMLIMLGLFTIGASRAGDISGAGATFPYPIYAKWADAYKKETGIGLNYQSIGSGGGIKQIEANTVTFGATDKPLDQKELDANDLVQFPMIMGGIVPVVNIESINPGELVLSGEVLSKIYLGEITKWNDPDIQALNKIGLPDMVIAVVHRSDGSGTTFNFAKYLASVSADWKDKVGVDASLEWPVGIGAKGNEGVASIVKQTAGSIGYVEYAYAKQNDLSYASIDNAQPSLKTFADKTWPITATSFILMHKTPQNEDDTKTALAFFDWAYKNGDKMAEELDYVPIPDDVVNQVHEIWKNIK